MGKKYEDIVKNIVTDADLDNIDFPLIAVNFKINKMSEFLSPELVEKLGGFIDDEEEFTEEEKKFFMKEEEHKQSELEDLKNNNTNISSNSTNVSNDLQQSS